MNEEFELTLEDEQIVFTAMEIVDYIDRKHCIDAELYDIVELIKLNLGLFLHFDEGDDYEQAQSVKS